MIPKCSLCRLERTVADAYDYNPIQVITGRPNRVVQRRRRRGLRRMHDKDDSRPVMKLKWTCEECDATGPFDETALWHPHDCKSRGPFDEVSRLSISPVQPNGSE